MPLEHLEAQLAGEFEGLDHRPAQEHSQTRVVCGEVGVVIRYRILQLRGSVLQRREVELHSSGSAYRVAFILPALAAESNGGRAFTHGCEPCMY